MNGNNINYIDSNNNTYNKIKNYDTNNYYSTKAKINKIIT